jgi:hypothetical protein
MSVDTVPPVADAAGFPPLAEKLEHFVYDRTNGMLRNLLVTIHEDEIVLSGSASSYYAKQLATHAIYEAIPDANLNNRIRVG